MGRAMQKHALRHMRTAFAQFDQDRHCPLTDSLDNTECMNGKNSPGWYFVHAQNDLNLRSLNML